MSILYVCKPGSKKLPGFLFYTKLSLILCILKSSNLEAKII